MKNNVIVIVVKIKMLKNRIQKKGGIRKWKNYAPI